MALQSYFGTECPHCERMEKLIQKLEQETGLTVERVEVWHDEDNMKKLEAIDNGDLCGGVPFFWNTETKAHLCGEVEYEELKEWAGGAIKN